MSGCSRMAMASFISLAVALVLALQAQDVDWTANGRDVQGTRYSPARNITRENVGRLEIAWTYRTGEMDPRTRDKTMAAFRRGSLDIVTTRDLFNEGVDVPDAMPSTRRPKGTLGLRPADRARFIRRLRRRRRLDVAGSARR
jgi:hypothetical protein